MIRFEILFLFAGISLFGQMHPDPGYYAYRKGTGAETRDSANEYTVLSFNVCMLDGSFPTRNGGMTPFEERLDKLAAFVKAENPDLFLGQELSLNSGLALYEAMKDEYPYFWIGMGRIPGVEQSGLFAASKIKPSGQPLFIPFPDELMSPLEEFPSGKRNLERGFFALELASAWVVSTHMEAGLPKDKFGLRRAQLSFLTRTMDDLAEGKPYILVGDLNISRTGKVDDEYSSSGIPDLYNDYYTTHYPQFDESTLTCTNLFTCRANGEPEPLDPEDRAEIDDYVLLRKSSRETITISRVDLLKTFDLNAPREEALSDHRAYKAVISCSDRKGTHR